MMGKAASIILTGLIVASAAQVARANVLVIGSTRPYQSKNGIKLMTEQEIIKLAKDRIAKDLKIRGALSIAFEDIHRSKQVDTAVGGRGSIGKQTYRCHSLAQWYYWPEGREQRMLNLQGKGATKWDAVVIMGDPSIMATMPGVYAEGATLIMAKVREGSAKPVILIPPTGNQEVADTITEVATRVGLTADTPVLPCPAPAVVQKASTTPFKLPNPFAMKYVDKRVVTYNQTGSSSERGIEGGLRAAFGQCGVEGQRVQAEGFEGEIDFNYGRANTGWEKNKMYKVDPKRFGRSYGFPMQDHAKTGAVTMRYGIDRRGNDGTDLGIAWDMVNQDEIENDIRCIPIRLMYAKLHEANPALTPFRDSWHMSSELDAASGAFMYALLSGRCPVGNEPSKENEKFWNRWLGQKIGYETAWRMAHLTARVPGFVVKPNETGGLDVKFLYPPQDTVTVAVSVSTPSMAEVTPKTLTFTPDNYSKTQAVTTTPKPGAVFSLKLITASNDAAFNKLCDSWPFGAKGK